VGLYQSSLVIAEVRIGLSSFGKVACNLLTCLIPAFNRDEHGAQLFTLSIGEYGCSFLLF
jgi:hypothetical protein